MASAGRIVQVGISPRSASVSMKDIPFKELDLMGSRNSLNLIPDGLALLARHPDQARALMTHRFAFEDLQQAYELMRSRTEKVGKILIEMPAAQTATRTGSGSEARSCRSLGMNMGEGSNAVLTPPDLVAARYDVVVVGSGAAGLVAAVRAADAGLSVLVAEKAAQLGGTTAAGGGVMWAPNNHLASAAGFSDSHADAVAYLTEAAGHVLTAEEIHGTSARPRARSNT